MKIELLTETTENDVHIMAQDASRTASALVQSPVPENNALRLNANQWVEYSFAVAESGYYKLHSLMGGGGYKNYDNQKFSVEIRIGEENGASTAYDDTYTSTEKSGGGDEGVAEHKAIEGVYLEQDKTYRIEFKPTELYEGGGFKLMDMRFIYRGETNE